MTTVNIKLPKEDQKRIAESMQNKMDAIIRESFGIKTYPAPDVNGYSYITQWPVFGADVELSKCPHCHIFHAPHCKPKQIGAPE